tara:strand:+ start:9 stop:485 length:477 start_codon:yes stop_codon:yes gene_type:complete
MKNKTILNIIFYICIIILCIAYFIEYVLGYQPCNLCLYERIPYFIAIIVIFFSLFFNRFEKLIFASLSLIFAAATILSFYHFGIEQGYFEESMVCVSNNEINSLSKENILKELQKETISCKKVDFRLFGLSLATINTIISFVISAITLKTFIQYEKDR